jgi:hypothetical protein
MRKIKFLGQSIGLEWFLLSVIVVAGIFLRIEAHKHLTAISPDGIAYTGSSRKRSVRKKGAFFPKPSSDKLHDIRGGFPIIRSHPTVFWQRHTHSSVFTRKTFL